MIQIKAIRLFVFLFVFIFSFLISSILYYHTKIELFQNDLHKVDLNLSGIELTYINLDDNSKTEYFSNGLAKEIFSNLQTEKTTVYLSDFYKSNLISYLSNFEKYCTDFNTISSCKLESLGESKQRFYSFSSFITDLGFFRTLGFKLEKDSCYELDKKKYYIEDSSIYSSDILTNSLKLEFVKRTEENRRVEWKQVSEEVNKIKEKLILRKYSSNNYFIKYKKCEQFGKENFISSYE